MVIHFQSFGDKGRAWSSVLIEGGEARKEEKRKGASQNPDASPFPPALMAVGFAL